MSKTATTDAEGRYKIPIAGGEYMVQYTGEGMSPLTMKVVVRPGVDRRVNVVLSPAPLSASPAVDKVAAAAAPAITWPVASDPLSSAVSEMMDKVAANGATNGAAV